MAALMVVLLHARLPGFANGWIGVDIFFTLSGFLITSILLSSLATHGTVQLRSFYLRRALRLLPAYAAVVLAAVLSNLVVDVGGTLKGALFSAFYVANWAAGSGQGLGSLEHTWSLSVEEQFYLAWPVVLLVVVRHSWRRGRTPVRAVLLLALLLQATTLVAVAAGAPDALVWNSTPARAVQLLTGAVLALALPRIRLALSGEPGRWLAGELGVVGLGGLLGYLALGQYGFAVLVGVTWPAVSVLTCLVIVSVVVARGGLVERLLSAGPLVSIGKVSYGLYLWHYLVFTTLDTRYGLDRARVLSLALLVTAVLVWASYVLVERPFLRRKERVR